MDASTAIDNARNSFREYCIKECKALCCRKGKLNLKQDELDLVVKSKSDRKRLKQEWDKSYSIDIETKPCPSLGKDFKCKIYSDEKRPKVCKDFPVFVFNKSIVVAPFCPATNSGILEPFLEELKKAGFKII